LQFDFGFLDPQPGLEPSALGFSLSQFKAQVGDQIR
jgi:hypothetical protein